MKRPTTPNFKVFVRKDQEEMEAVQFIGDNVGEIKEFIKTCTTAEVKDIYMATTSHGKIVLILDLPRGLLKLYVTDWLYTTGHYVYEWNNKGLLEEYMEKGT